MKIHGYRLEHRIAQGGTSLVYRAVQEKLARTVALKVLSPLHADSPEHAQRFLVEGKLLASLAHTHIVTIHDVGICKGIFYIAMELASGGDLRDRMHGPLEPGVALAYAETIARALFYAHARGIVHRDVKPTNVLFRADGSLLLSDFGIAKLLDREEGLTIAGTTLGSPHYLSPEQARNARVDGRADIYSLGIVLYEMLTGSKPFDGDSEVQIAMRHLDEPLPALPAHLSAYRGLLDKMTAKDPEDRFEGAASLALALEAARRPSPQRAARA